MLAGGSEWQIGSFWLINKCTSSRRWWCEKKTPEEPLNVWNPLQCSLTCAQVCSGCVNVCCVCTQLSCKLQHWRPGGVALRQFICISNGRNCGAPWLWMWVCVRLIMRCNYDVATTRMTKATPRRAAASPANCRLHFSCNIVAMLQSQRAEQKVCWQPQETGKGWSPIGIRRW